MQYVIFWNNLDNSEVSAQRKNVWPRDWLLILYEVSSYAGFLRIMEIELCSDLQAVTKGFLLLHRWTEPVDFMKIICNYIIGIYKWAWKMVCPSLNLTDGLPRKAYILPWPVNPVIYMGFRSSGNSTSGPSAFSSEWERYCLWKAGCFRNKSLCRIGRRVERLGVENNLPSFSLIGLGTRLGLWFWVDGFRSVKGRKTKESQWGKWWLHWAAQTFSHHHCWEPHIPHWIISLWINLMKWFQGF